jgi:uncharacterized membrane protein YfcA
MNRARSAFLAATALLGVCACSLLLFIVFDTLLHVKIPYAVVSSFFGTAIVMFWTVRIAYRRSESRADTTSRASDTTFSAGTGNGFGEATADAGTLVIAAPYHSADRGNDRVDPTRARSPRIYLRSIILFGSLQETSKDKKETL